MTRYSTLFLKLARLSLEHLTITIKGGGSMHWLTSHCAETLLEPLKKLNFKSFDMVLPSKELDDSDRTEIQELYREAIFPG